MKKIEFSPGCYICNAIIELKNKGYECYGEFNGNKIYSTETEDEIYKKVTGMSCEEFYADIEKHNYEYYIACADHKLRIPELAESYRLKARGIISEDKLELWDEIVPIRLDDLYEGMELDCWLELISILNDEDKTKEERFSKCKDLFRNQGHSGMSANLVFSGLRSLHKYGDELVEFIRK